MRAPAEAAEPFSCPSRGPHEGQDSNRSAYEDKRSRRRVAEDHQKTNKWNAVGDLGHDVGVWNESWISGIVGVALCLQKPALFGVLYVDDAVGYEPRAGPKGDHVAGLESRGVLDCRRYGDVTNPKSRHHTPREDHHRVKPDYTGENGQRHQRRWDGDHSADRRLDSIMKPALRT